MSLSDLSAIVAKSVMLLVAISAVVLILTYAERKALARIQQRLGPTRVGFGGILQPVADAFILGIEIGPLRVNELASRLVNHDLEHIDRAILNRELHIHQAHYLKTLC